MIKSFMTTLIILSLQIQVSFAEEGPVVSAPFNANYDNIVKDESFMDQGVLQSNLSGQIIKRLGEPGYYFSKYLNFRRQITTPVCYTSQQINKAAIIVALVGDITIHAFDYFETKKLKKKFESRLEEIKQYRIELNNNKKKLLDHDQKSPEIQLESLKYLKSAAEIELKRAEMDQKIVYLTLGLQLTSQAIAALEVAAETGSGGTLLAKNEFCFQAKMKQQLAEEERTAKLISGEIVTRPKTALTDFSNREDIPWYFVPFQWLAGGLGFIEDSSLFQNYKSYKGGISKDQRIREGSTGGIDDKTPNSGQTFMQLSQSAGYAEEMLVDVTMDVIKKWSKNKSKQTIQDEINNNDKDKAPSKIMKFVKGLGLDEIAVRYAIRTLIQSNMVAVNTFMRSPPGKLATYAYNLYVTKRTIDVTEAQVTYAKQKNAILEKSITDFESETKTSWSPILLEMLETILPATANAAINKSYLFPNPPCMQDISPKCDGSIKDFLSMDSSTNFKNYPKDIQIAHQNILTNNYSLLTALQLSTGKFSIEKIDVEKTKALIQNLENINKDLESKLLKNKIDFRLKAQNFKTLQNDENFFPKEMLLASKAEKFEAEILPKKPEKLISKETIIADEANFFSESKEAAMQNETELVNNNHENSNKEVQYYDVGISNIYKKDTNIFQVISNRYYLIFNK